MTVPREQSTDGVPDETGGTEAFTAFPGDAGVPADPVAPPVPDPARDPRLFRARGSYRPWYVRDAGPLRGRRQD